MTNKRNRKRAIKTARTPQKKGKSKSSSGVNVIDLANRVGSMVMQRMAPPPPSNSFLGNLGQFAGNGISKIFGLGAYKMSRNSLWDNQTGSSVPFMHSSVESFVFRHREYLGDLASSTTFSSRVFSINPGLEDSFPYLSLIASNFQEYKLRGMIVEYKTTSSTVVTGANTAMGTVSLVAQYRADAPVLTSKLQVLNEMWSEDGRPCDNIILPIECSPKENPMAIQYVRTGSLPANSDVKMFDLAKVTIATQGQQTAGTTIGELWVSYEVELYKPVLGVGSSSVEGAYLANLTGVNQTRFLGSAKTVLLDNIGMTVGVSNISFPQGATGTYMLSYVYKFGAAAFTAPTFTSLNCVLTSSEWSPNNGTTTDEAQLSMVITITGDTVEDVSSITFVGGVSSVVDTTAVIRIVQVNSSMV